LRHARAAHISIFLLSVTGVAACHDATAPVQSSLPAPVALSQLPRALTVPETSVRDASNAFSFGLWAAVNAAQADSNVFISPLSASFALAMTMNGTATTTYDQMHAALDFGNLPLSTIDSGYKSLTALLESLDPSVTMQIANSIWYRNTFPVLPSFIDTAQAYFGATVKGLDFTNVPSSLAAINGWVSSATNGKIPSVLSTIDPTMMMFLVNAIYFKGSWRSQFDASQTETAAFTSSTNVAEPMQLMHQVTALPYVETATYQAVDLPYGDSAFTMTVVLPKAGTDVQTLAKSLTPAAWQFIVEELQVSGQVDLSLPKLTLSYQRQLVPDLEALGMVVPFSAGGADFTSMAPDPFGSLLYLELVQQNSFLDINEQGTEASAATVVGAGLFTSANLGPIVMRVDHPYIIVIRERLTGTVLFMGKVVRMPS
jgi:serine protease inhibitor